MTWSISLSTRPQTARADLAARFSECEAHQSSPEAARLLDELARTLAEITEGLHDGANISVSCNGSYDGADAANPHASVSLSLSY